MDVEEYLHTSFEPECEFLDGGLVDRYAGDLPHSTTMANMIFRLQALRARLGVRALPIIRICITPTRYRVADVAVWRDDNLGDARIPTVPPFLAVEILSPEDRMTRMLPKIQEYLAFGIEYVWLIDPEEKSALIFTHESPGGSVVADILRTTNPAI